MRDILRISVPLTAWLACFSAVYGLHGLVCSEHWAEAGLGGTSGRAALLTAWIASIALQALLLLGLSAPRGASPSGFVQRLSVALAAVALISTIWTLLPVATNALCL